MERLKKSIAKEYITSRLYIEDLIEIQNILSSTTNFKIIVSDYSYENVEDLISNSTKKSFNDLSISTSNPHISLHITNDYTILRSYSDDDLSTGIFTKIDYVMSGATLKPNFVYSFYALFATNIVLGLTPVLSSELGEVSQLLSYISLVWMFWLIYIRMFNAHVIKLEKRENKTNFLKKNADKLLLITIGALITFLFDEYLAKLFNFLLEKF